MQLLSTDQPAWYFDKIIVAYVTPYNISYLPVKVLLKMGPSLSEISRLTQADRY